MARPDPAGLRFFEAPRSLAMVLASALAIGCSDDARPPPGGSGGTAGAPALPEPMPASEKATVKLKTAPRLLADIAAVLELEEAELCSEIGGKACGTVHAIALGGTDAYQSGVYEPIAASIATSPIAVERIVLSACRTRAGRDLDQPGDARLFVGLPVDAEGAMDATAAPAAEAVTQLYRRALLREPTAAELERVTGLYSTLVEQGSTEPARDWASLGCFAVLTTMEFLFY